MPPAMTAAIRLVDTPAPSVAMATAYAVLFTRAAHINGHHTAGDQSDNYLSRNVNTGQEAFKSGLHWTDQDIDWNVNQCGQNDTEKWENQYRLDASHAAWQEAEELLEVNHGETGQETNQQGTEEDASFRIGTAFDKLSACQGTTDKTGNQTGSQPY